MWGFIGVLLGEVLDFLAPFFAGYQKAKAESAEENVKILFEKNKQLANRPRTLSNRLDRLRRWKEFMRDTENDSDK